MDGGILCIGCAEGFGCIIHYAWKGGNIMALKFVNIGEKRTVMKLCGKDEMIRHLQELGFTPGSEVQVMGGNAAGMILLVKGVRIALDRGLAGRIMVA